MVRFRQDCRGGDHPRSRGVYSPVEFVYEIVDGSSPLARGLPLIPARKRAPSRIIPARAGFTMRGLGGTAWDKDHPRSRGVYRSAVHLSFTVAGSSPLARGLRRGSPTPCASRRIIPARAGFTGPGSPRRRNGPDHPRSRGVYCHGLSRRFAHVGSSPLAWGLRS